MYQQWAPARGYHLSIVDEHPNVDVGSGSGSGSIGYRSITLKLIGKMAYGWFKNEAGVSSNMNHLNISYVVTCLFTHIPLHTHQY